MPRDNHLRASTTRLPDQPDRVLTPILNQDDLNNKQKKVLPDWGLTQLRIDPLRHFLRGRGRHWPKTAPLTEVSEEL